MKRYIKSTDVSIEVKQSYLYQLLARLCSDCKYVLDNYDGTYANSTKSKEERYLAQKYLWANNAKDQIAKMRELYDRLELKPDWITPEEIDEYERRFKEILGDKYVSAATDVNAYTYVPSGSFVKSKDVTREVREYCEAHPEFADLGNEIAGKDIWVKLYPDDFEFELSYNGLKSDYHLDHIDDLVAVMRELYPESWYDSGAAETSSVNASNNPFYDKLSESDKRFADQTKKDIGVITLKDNVGKYEISITIDMWYGDKFEPMKYGADAWFSDADGVYRGNIYDETGKVIGDYTADDSSLISKNFQIDWGE